MKKLSLLLLAALCTLACRRGDEGPVQCPEPLTGEIVTSNEIHRIYEVKLNDGYDIEWPVQFPCDTCIKGLIAYQPKDQDYDSIRYTIGNDPRVWTGPTSLFMEDAGDSVVIRTRVYRSKSERCVSDTMVQHTQTLKLLPFGSQWYWGSFQGYNLDEPNRVFTIDIVKDTNLSNSFYNRQTSGIFHLIPTCNDETYHGYILVQPTLSGNYNRFVMYPRDYFSFPLDTACFNARGEGFMRGRNNIEITYHLSPERGAPVVTKTFVGTRVK